MLTILGKFPMNWTHTWKIIKVFLKNDQSYVWCFLEIVWCWFSRDRIVELLWSDTDVTSFDLQRNLRTWVHFLSQLTVAWATRLFPLSDKLPRCNQLSGNNWVRKCWCGVFIIIDQNTTSLSAQLSLKGLRSKTRPQKQGCTSIHRKVRKTLNTRGFS